MSQDKCCQIVRCPHDSENPYSMINNELIRNSCLSPEARWLLIYLLSHEKSFNPSPKYIMKSQGIGRDRLYKRFNELINEGYVLREEFKDTNNLLRIRYTYSERPKFKKCFRRPDFQDTEFQDPENTYIKNKQVKNEHIKESISLPKKRENSKNISEIDRNVTSYTEKNENSKYIKRKHGQHVEFSEEEYETWKKKLGEDRLKEMIQVIDDHCINNRPKGYKDYSAAMRTFLRNKVERKHVQPSTSIEKNKERLKKFSEENPDLIKRQVVNIYEKYIELSDKNSHWVINISENGFIDQLENKLRKWQIPFKSSLDSTKSCLG